MPDFQWNEAGWAELQKAVHRDLEQRGKRVAERARRLCARGPETIPPHIHVADTIEVEPEGDDVYIGSRHPRALMLEKGTSPHEIRPHAGGVLAWRGGDGKMRFARVVHHPGTRAQPFLRPALYTPEV
jgi:hypothetical protein